jgi:hypothetical protein
MSRESEAWLVLSDAKAGFFMKTMLLLHNNCGKGGFFVVK